jgi:hypothetical protein
LVGPPDEVLGPLLHEFARRGLKTKHRLTELHEKYGYVIRYDFRTVELFNLTYAGIHSERTLRNLNTNYDVPSVQKVDISRAEEVVAELVAEDTEQRNGPATIAIKARRTRSIPIPRYEVVTMKK